MWSPKFLHQFDGIIWNLLASDTLLVIEVRNTAKKQALFSALDTRSDSFLWKDSALEEPWWVNASAIARDKLLVTIYTDTNNPDKKGLLAYSIKDLSLVWWNNDFSLAAVGDRHIRGFTSKLGLKQCILDIETGKEVFSEIFTEALPPTGLLKPVQYIEGTEHFQMVRTFLADRLNFQAVLSLEYFEDDKCIIISCYKTENDELANYLFVLSTEGKVLLQEKLDGPVKGIGYDTFFILQGCVIFVKNKVELVSYKII